ncbi:ATP-dependent DNA helicase [Wukongibacter baidiensis]|uniref:ATP-dependent DNA helicase n=1 Tax=Wukongibacter baidiensis TaxID=1723361 RepID=UPI003D7F5876
MNNAREKKISIRNLVEFILREGDISSGGFTSYDRALEGAKAHRKIQKSYDDGYESEVTLKYTVDYEGDTLTVQGRADGILFENEKVIIDEIKTVVIDLEKIDEEFNELHWAQAKCYGYIYGHEKDLEEIDIQLTYYNIETEEMKKLRRTFSIDVLEQFFSKLVEEYFKWIAITKEWDIERNKSIVKLDFPFSSYRKGQRNLAVATYKTIKDDKKLYVQAPTGIGKTISTLFPTIKAMGEGLTSKIFYLTAKTITRTVAEEAFVKMREKGLKMKTITLTAKDKICFQEERKCDPEECPYAAGHFDRVNEALMDIICHEENFTRQTIEKYSEKHKVCPFEFALDLSLWSDCIICDYNYVFDPRVYLKRFFSQKGDYVFLVDEAHNLVDRARTMFSAQLYKRQFLELKRTMKEKSPGIAKSLNKLNSFMIDMKKLCNEGKSHIQKEYPIILDELLENLINQCEFYFASNRTEEIDEKLSELYFDALSFLKIGELYDERYITYIEKENKDTKIKIFCLDPSELIKKAIKRGKSGIFFSATLAPLKYFKEILGGEDEDHMLVLPSPFSKEQFSLLITKNISTRLRDRENSYSQIVKYVEAAIKEKPGNYLVFFPSYAYLQRVHEEFQENNPEILTLVQNPLMTEQEREAFLDEFKPNPSKSLLGFAVLGGLFSEGIDFTEDRLSGAIIIGVGLPQISLENNIIKGYFDNKNSYGYEYAYTYPGMNKVLQAAGRVIRTKNDKGTILLIDDRFTYYSYRRIFPREWSHSVQVYNSKQVETKLRSFWNK